MLLQFDAATANYFTPPGDFESCLEQPLADLLAACCGLGRRHLHRRTTEVQVDALAAAQDGCWWVGCACEIYAWGKQHCKHYVVLKCYCSLARVHSDAAPELVPAVGLCRRLAQLCVRVGR